MTVSTIDTASVSTSENLSGVSMFDTLFSATAASYNVGEISLWKSTNGKSVLYGAIKLNDGTDYKINVERSLNKAFKYIGTVQEVIEMGDKKQYVTVAMVSFIDSKKEGVKFDAEYYAKGDAKPSYTMNIVANDTDNVKAPIFKGDVLSDVVPLEVETVPEDAF